MLTLCRLDNVGCLFVLCRLLNIVSTLIFGKNLARIFSNCNQFEPDHFVVPDLSPNCLQRLSAYDKSHDKNRSHLNLTSFFIFAIPS